MTTTIGVRKYNMAAAAPLTADVSGVANGAVTTVNSHLGALNPDNPMMWLFGIGAVTLGLVAFSTSVRIGAFKASVSGGSGG